MSVKTAGRDFHKVKATLYTNLSIFVNTAKTQFEKLDSCITGALEVFLKFD